MAGRLTMGFLATKLAKATASTTPATSPRAPAQPQAEPVATAPTYTPDTEPDPTRVGLVAWDDGKPFVHYCAVCGAWGSFGYDVDLRNDRLGRWYCLLHRPEG
jgi:hypothetical protein